MNRGMRWFCGLLLILSTACGGSDGGSGPPTGPTPDFALSVAPETLTIVIGERGDLLITITRSGGFTGAVSVSVDGLPSGVQGASLTIEEGLTSGAILVSVSHSADPGVWALTVRASAPSVGNKSREATLVTHIVT